jgi:hypothetical protein
VFSNPTTPNLTDYLSFLAGIGIPPPNTPQAPNASQVFPILNGTATGGDVANLIDNSQQWSANQWAGYFLTDVTQSQTTYLASSDPITLNFVTPFAAPVQADDAYQIVPGIVPTSLAIALEIVNDVLARVSPSIYTLAVYNLAADRLINYAPDVPGQTFFADLRKLFRIMDVSVGVPSSANDQGTAVGILNPEQMKLLTLADLQTLKTFCGRNYMGIAQGVGRTVFGLS